MHYSFGLSIHLSHTLIPILVNTLREILQIWHRHLVGLKDELISQWRSKVKILGHLDLLPAPFS